MEQQKNPRPLKKISPSEEEEFVFEPFKFYAPVNVPARKSRIFCFRGVFTPRGDEGGVDRTASARANLKIPFPRILLSCCSSSMRARTDHCKRRYRMNGIAIPFAEATANLSTNLIVGRITDQCRYLWWNCSRIRGGFRRWRGEEIGKKLMEGWFRSRGNPEFHASRGLMTIRRDAREVDGGDAASPPPSLFHHCDITRRYKIFVLESDWKVQDVTIILISHREIIAFESNLFQELCIHLSINRVLRSSNLDENYLKATRSKVSQKKKKKK